MESWSYGFKPNFVAEMRDWYSWSDAPPLDDLLRQIARRDFGAGSEDSRVGSLEATQRRRPPGSRYGPHRGWQQRTG